MSSRQPPELKFQQHISDYLVAEHGYGVLEQTDITDTVNAVAEDHLWAFLSDTQSETIKKLTVDYGTDARGEVFRALQAELQVTPLWVLIRHGLKVRGLEFRLYYPKPRSGQSSANDGYPKNRITFRPHFYFGATNKEIDLVLFLNGLPIVALEVKHEKNQVVHDAVRQFTQRDQSHKIFQHPFLFLAADTSDVMAATDPRAEGNFRWHNMGLVNEPQNEGQYPVEFLYREVLAKDQLLEALSFFLVRVPKRETIDDKPERPAFTLFPRYHQSRMVRRVAEDALSHFVNTGQIGRKYLINHSAGSGKTLSICWLADRLNSLYAPGKGGKLVDMIFILTDRKSLDKNIRDEVENFAHIKDVIGLAGRADDLPRFIKERRSIIVTTQQKFSWILSEIEKDQSLKNLRVAFLIDEAHRSQEGKMGLAIRKPFRATGVSSDVHQDVDDADVEIEQGDEEEEIVRIIREHDLNQLFVAFTATPAPATLSLFGDPFDTYTEAEAIAEGYIVDVAASIISYKTLYNLHCRIVPGPDEEMLYPKGVVAKALKTVAFQDDGLIQYKSEVMLRLFDETVGSLIDGRAKAMIVTSSRVAGLRYFNVIKQKLKERGANYKVLYAFSDFVHPLTNETISEHSLNELNEGELIEDRFEGDDYRLMVVANKFQTGFDQPLLAGMFLDKPVVDRNAVQTVSRLNRAHPSKKDVVVVDFTNNASSIMKAFSKYRAGTPFESQEPDENQCSKLLEEILQTSVFVAADAKTIVGLIAVGDDAPLQASVNQMRVRFQDCLIDAEDRKAFVYLMARFVKTFNFLSCFFTYPTETQEFAAFAEYVGPQLIKQGSVSELMKHIRQTEVIKAAVQYVGEVHGVGGTMKVRTGPSRKQSGPPQPKISIRDMIADIQARFAITDEEALYIREVTEEKSQDLTLRTTVQAHKEDRSYLDGPLKHQVNGQIQDAYVERGRYQDLADQKYTGVGAIFDIMAVTVVQHHFYASA